MGTGATAKYGLPYPLPTDNPNIEGDLQALASAVDAILVAYVPDNTLANRPAASKQGWGHALARSPLPTSGKSSVALPGRRPTSHRGRTAPVAASLT
jgi:hypothetical protein